MIRGTTVRNPCRGSVAQRCCSSHSSELLSWNTLHKLDSCVDNNQLQYVLFENKFEKWTEHYFYCLS
ncbi:LOW QUALITY PROTEIN: hypothetical protein AQUCO_06000035v1 [Aquilegia coerulea]|uniref:Uncharacterized protein n=1 Tax=Aquilegia coerulea TaxID=218851 RepID=A0A2G5CDL8_AQUCA|nr:LOW QUALITY PROTEIN: hypothetical protein AQUCO_06000035v1 [Aquilegia coerulea]